MTRELEQIEKTIDKTREQFLHTARRATRELDQRRKRLRKEIEKAILKTNLGLTPNNDGKVIVESNRILRHQAAAENSRLLPPGRWPRTADVAGTNYVDIAATMDERHGRVIVLAVLDNLVKGAAGQAVQAFNLMTGHPETTGLGFPGLYPN